MPTLREQMIADVAGVFLNEDEHAIAITLTHPAGDEGETDRQMLSLLGLPPPADEEIDDDDLEQWLRGYRWGDTSATTETVSAIFDEDKLDALQGANLETEWGRRITELALLRLSADVTITCDDKPERCTYATIDGARWNCLRVVGRDEAMQTVALRRDLKSTTRKSRGRP